MSTRAGLLDGGKSGAAVVPGAPDGGRLLRAVMRASEKLKMPLSGGKLKHEEIADLKYWIQIWAPWTHETLSDQAGQKVEKTEKGSHFRIRPEQRDFWSFQPLKKTAPPAVKDNAWAKGSIDRFILAKLEEKNLKPVPQADKLAIIRRAAFDLSGLRPKLEQVEAFQADTSPDAFAKVVDRLPASPHYGERWARHWLDDTRYADGGGGARGSDACEPSHLHRLAKACSVAWDGQNGNSG